MAIIVSLVLAACVCVVTATAHYQVHELITGVSLHGDRFKRENNRKSIRIAPFYDTSVERALSSEKVNMLRTETVPKMIEFFQNSLSVNRVQGSLLFNRDCTGGSFFPSTNLGENVRGCETTCSAATKCGPVTIPEAHLKQCIQCNGNGNQCKRVGTDETGLSNADIVLYISADGTRCPSSETVAVATACQLEDSLDRPIAGNVNFCPSGVTNTVASSVLELAKHEASHALAFAFTLFTYWRNPDGTPRTARDSRSGLPLNRNSNGHFIPSTDTIRNVVYNDWRTINGIISHNVTHMVTPAVLREARDHFNCSSLAGLELENQGGSGTALSHWEKRILGNEVMTGVLTFNPVFSRITLAAFEDSGWYNVNYSMAQDLVWGRGAGCRFVVGSCLEWITTHNNGGLPVTPFCTDHSTDTVFSCTSDHGAVGRCNLGQENPPPDYQYFATRTDGGGITIADYCPFVRILNIANGGTTECSVSGNQPTPNILAEVYGPNSRCIRHGNRTWTNSRYTMFHTGAGCYQYQCSPMTGVTVVIANLAYRCSCEGEELQFSFSDGGTSFTGSLICPACSQLCYDDLSKCPTTEPASCYGRVTETQGSTDVPVTLSPGRVTETQGTTDVPVTPSPGRVTETQGTTDVPVTPSPGRVTDSEIQGSTNVPATPSPGRVTETQGTTDVPVTPSPGKVTGRVTDVPVTPSPSGGVGKACAIAILLVVVATTAILLC